MILLILNKMSKHFLKVGEGRAVRFLNCEFLLISSINTDWLIDWSIDWLVDWLIDWLVDLVSSIDIDNVAYIHTMKI